MTLNLNFPEEVTLESVAAFIASEDDSIHRQVRITQGGIAFISDAVGADHIEGLAFRIETWCAGNGYFGKQASQDAEWVERVHTILLKNWPEPKSSYLDQY